MQILFHSQGRRSRQEFYNAFCCPYSRLSAARKAPPAGYATLEHQVLPLKEGLGLLAVSAHRNMCTSHRVSKQSRVLCD